MNETSDQPRSLDLNAYQGEVYHQKLDKLAYQAGTLKLYLFFEVSEYIKMILKYRTLKALVLQIMSNILSLVKKYKLDFT